MDYYDMPQIDKSGSNYPSLQYVPSLSPSPGALQRSDINKYVGGDILTSCDWTALIHRPAEDSEPEDLPSTVDTEALKEPATPLPPPLTPRPPTPPQHSESEDDSSGSDSEPDSSSDSNSDAQEGSEDSSSWSDSDSSESSEKAGGGGGRSSSSSGSQSPQTTFSIRETNFDQGGLKLKILATKPKVKAKFQQPESTSSCDSSSSDESSKGEKKIPDLKNTFKSPSQAKNNPRDSPPILEPQTEIKPDAKIEKSLPVREVSDPPRSLRSVRNSDQPPSLSRPIRSSRKHSVLSKTNSDIPTGPPPKPQARATTRPLRNRKQPDSKSSNKAGLAGSGLRGAGGDGGGGSSSDESSSSSEDDDDEERDQISQLLGPPPPPPIPPSTEPLQVINQEDLAAILPDVGGGGSFDGFEDGRAAHAGTELLPERVPAGSGVTSSSSDVELLPEQEQIVSEAIKRINLDSDIKNVRPPSPHSDPDQMGYSSNLLQQFVEKTEMLSRGEAIGEVVARKRGRPPRGAKRDTAPQSNVPASAPPELDLGFMRLDCAQSNVSPDSGIQSVAGSPLHHGMSPSPRSPNNTSPTEKKESHHRSAISSHNKSNNSSSTLTKDKLSRLHTTRLPIMHLENEKRGPGRPKGILRRKKGKGRRGLLPKEKVAPPIYLPPAATQLKVPPFIAGETKAPNLKPNISVGTPTKRGRGRPKKTPPTLEPVIPLSTSKSHKHKKRRKLLKELVLDPEFLSKLESLSDQFQKLYISVSLPPIDSSKLPVMFTVKRSSKKRKNIEKKVVDKEPSSENEVKEKIHTEKNQTPSQLPPSNTVKRRPKKTAVEPPKSKDKPETSNEQRLPLKKRHYHISSHSTSLSSEETTEPSGDTKDLKIVVKSVPYPVDKNNTTAKTAHSGGKGLHPNGNTKQSVLKVENLKKVEQSRSSSVDNIPEINDDIEEDVKGELDHESVIVTPKKRHRLEQDKKSGMSTKSSVLKEKEQGVLNCKRTLNRVASSSQSRGLSPQGTKRSARHVTKTDMEAKAVTPVIKSSPQDSPTHMSILKRSQRNMTEGKKNRDSSEEEHSKRNLRTRDMSPSVKEAQDSSDKGRRLNEIANRLQGALEEGSKRTLRTRDESPALKPQEVDQDTKKVRANDSVIKSNQEYKDDLPIKRSLRARDLSPVVKVDSEDPGSKKNVRDTVGKLHPDVSDEVSGKRSLRVRDSSPAIKPSESTENLIKKSGCNSRDMSPSVRLTDLSEDILNKKVVSGNDVLKILQESADESQAPPKRKLRVRDNSPAVKLSEQSESIPGKEITNKSHELPLKRSLRVKEAPAVKLEGGKTKVLKEPLAVKAESGKTKVLTQPNEDSCKKSDETDSTTKKKDKDISQASKVALKSTDNVTASIRVESSKDGKAGVNKSLEPLDKPALEVAPPVLNSLSTRSASKLSNLPVQSLVSPIPLVPDLVAKTPRLRGDKKPPAGVFEPSAPDEDGTPLIDLPELPLKTPPVYPLSKQYSITEKHLSIIDNNLKMKRSNEGKENSNETKKSKILTEVQDVKCDIKESIVNIVKKAIKLKRKKTFNRTGFPMKKKKRKKTSEEGIDVVPPILEDQRIIPSALSLEESTPALSPIIKIEDKIKDESIISETNNQLDVNFKCKIDKKPVIKIDEPDSENNITKHDLRPGRRKTFKEEEKSKDKTEIKQEDKVDRPKRKTDTDKTLKPPIPVESETESAVSSVPDSKPLPPKRVRKYKEECDDSDADSVRLRKKNHPRWRKKFLPAGLFSDFFKDDEPGKKSGDSSKQKPGTVRVDPLLPPPAYCSKWVRQRKLPFQLPYDLWWLHEHNQLPGRDVVPSWNYKKIRTNVYYDIKPTFNYEAQACNCKPMNESACGDDCINRMVFAECSSQLCPCKEKCLNQKIQRHEWSPGIIKFMTKDKGWGIKTKYAIKTGIFILEYVGEVVSDREFKARMATRYTEDTHHYCLHLDGGLVIDGHRMGGEGRFVNHSCEPNCEMQKWSVNGLFRMALFALRDIEPSEELTYDYNFSLFNPAEGQPCKCGSTKCRGVIGGKYQRVTVVKSTPVVDEKSKTTNQVGRPRKNARKIKSGKKIVGNKTTLSKDLKVSLKDNVGALASVAARLNHPPLKPLTPQQKTFILDNKCFLIRNLEKVNQFREKLKQVMGGGLVPVASAPEQEKPSQTVQSTAKEADVFLTQLQALSCPRNMKTRRLAQAEDNPEMTKTARLACIFKDLYNEVVTAKDESGDILSSNFVTLPSKRKFPLFYQRISNPIDFQTIEQNIVTGVYRVVENFDQDMNALFKNNVRWYGRTSELGIAATRLRKIYNLAKLNNIDKIKEIIGEEVPLSFIPQKEDPGGEEEDVIHCICGLFRDEGMMIQCERCLVWQHCDCVRADTSVEHYLCEKCNPRPVNLEITFPKEPDYAQPGQYHHVTLLRGDIQIKQGDTVYVLRDIIDEDSASVPKSKHTYKTIKNWKYTDCDIFKVERLWKDEKGDRFAFGHHFLRPHETYHEPTRKFFPNELMRVPLYEVVPLDLIMGHCHVLDLNTFCKGRPIGASPDHIYICEYRVDKAARVFAKVAKSKQSQICTKSYAFETYDVRLKPQRSYAPHGDAPPVISSALIPAPLSTKSGSIVRGRGGRTAQHADENVQRVRQPIQKPPPKRQDKKTHLNKILLKLLARQPNNKVPLDVSYLLEPGRRQRKKPALLNS